jgi:hypothetical protein
MRSLWLTVAVVITSAMLGAQAPAVRDPLPVPDIPGFHTGVLEIALPLTWRNP